MSATDLSHLPKAKPEAKAGNAPIPHPIFAPEVARMFDEAAKEGDNKPQVADTAFRLSSSGMCGQRIRLVLDAKTDPTIEIESMDLAGHWSTGMGTWAHAEWEKAMTARYGEAFTPEVPSVYGQLVSGSMDGLLVLAPDHPDYFPVRQALMATGLLPGFGEDVVGTTRIGFELKSKNGYGFKQSVGAFNDPAEGPDGTHVIQGALNGYLNDCDVVVLMMLSKECIGPDLVKKAGINDVSGRFAAEWLLNRTQIENIAKAELARMTRIADGTDTRRFIPLFMPKGAEVVDPTKGRWELRETADDGTLNVIQAGKAWYCGYCPVQAACVARWRAERAEAAA